MISIKFKSNIDNKFTASNYFTITFGKNYDTPGNNNVMFESNNSTFNYNY